MDDYKRVYLKDYKPLGYSIKTVDLWIDFFDDKTFVRSRLAVRKREQNTDFPPLVLKGEDLVTLNILVDGIKPCENKYELKKDELIIYPEKDFFYVETLCEIHPEKNTSLEGIYKSDSFFCSQCEAEGFRKITWHPDRPDVMSEFRCCISGDKAKYPVLLSNGNIVEQGDLGDGRHYAKWHDPFLKPSYLFAVVAGDLYCVEDHYETMSGKNVVLRLFTEPENKTKCFYALNSLKKAMKWDEDVFSREYDLDIYMIVAVRAFNMGAMENKGLNIFNSNYVLADEKTGTDDDFFNIESVVSHEYFHNWTGNRITLANWFQLSLKEGLTVFRDQLFSSEQGFGPVSRIKDVRALKSRQFPEDSGPFSHPVRPESYIEMNNFYTATVYEKGAEIIRMIYNWLGRENFTRAMNHYFEKFDMQAVTCEDFISSMSEASGYDLWQFMRWYEQSGTPFIKFEYEYFENEKKLVLKTYQEIPDTPGENQKLAVPVPVKAAFFDRNGNQLEIYKENTGISEKETVFLLTKKEQKFVFENIVKKPLPSLLRNFSAPVRFDAGYGMEDDIFLMSGDTDPFNRWEASQRVVFRVIKDFYESILKNEDPVFPENVFDAFLSIINDTQSDKSIRAEILTLPLYSDAAHELINCGFKVNPDILEKAVSFLVKSLSIKFEKDFLRLINENICTSYVFSKEQTAARRLKNTSLFYISKLDYSDFIFDLYLKSDNMTDTTASLRALVQYENDKTEKALSDFYTKWKHDPVVMDKWFAAQASSSGEHTFEKVCLLFKDPLFSIKNPNRVRSLVGVFANNFTRFHRQDGEGYRFLADNIIELSKINPQIAARLVSYLSNYKKFDAGTKDMMEKNLRKISKVENLPKDVFEMVSRAIGD